VTLAGIGRTSAADDSRRQKCRLDWTEHGHRTSVSQSHVVVLVGSVSLFIA